MWTTAADASFSPNSTRGDATVYNVIDGKLQVTSYKLQATSYKLQATSYKLQEVFDLANGAGKSAGQAPKSTEELDASERLAVASLESRSTL